MFEAHFPDIRRARKRRGAGPRGLAAFPRGSWRGAKLTGFVISPRPISNKMNMSRPSGRSGSHGLTGLHRFRPGLAIPLLTQQGRRVLSMAAIRCRRPKQVDRKAWAISSRWADPPAGNTGLAKKHLAAGDRLGFDPWLPHFRGSRAGWRRACTKAGAELVRGRQ